MATRSLKKLGKVKLGSVLWYTHHDVFSETVLKKIMCPRQVFYFSNFFFREWFFYFQSFCDDDGSSFLVVNSISRRQVFHTFRWIYLWNADEGAITNKFTAAASLLNCNLHNIALLRAGIHSNHAKMGWWGCNSIRRRELWNFHSFKTWCWYSDRNRASDII